MHTRLAFLCVPLLLAFASCCALPLTANKKPPLHPINLNTATALELQQVPGIGPSTADKILKMRRSYGAFKSVDDLRAIKGIGPKRMEKMRKYITVGQPVAAKKPASAGATKPSGPANRSPQKAVATNPSSAKSP
ncbi:MAG TPA: helix-hairpin-helix domain-containing protein [Candidatus Acidoferrum sp.]|jgi:comEA protein